MMSESQAIEHLKNGNGDQRKHAFEYIFGTYSESLHRYLIRIIGKKEAAEDLLQETFMKVIQKIHFFETNPEVKQSFKSWIFRIATHLAIDVLRRESRSIEIIYSLERNEDGSQSPHAFSENLENQERLQKALDSLPGNQRLFLILKEQEGMSCMEIAKIYGCTENAVKQGVFRARMSMRKKLCT